MKYVIDWTEDGESALAAAYLRAADRQAVTAAQAEAERRLVYNPLASGKPVSEGLYAIDVPPLRLQFEVSEPDRVVTIVSVGSLR